MSLSSPPSVMSLPPFLYSTRLPYLMRASASFASPATHSRFKQLPSGYVIPPIKEVNVGPKWP